MENISKFVFNIYTQDRATLAIKIAYGEPIITYKEDHIALINKYKEDIDTMPVRRWDLYKKLVNPYELLHIPHRDKNLGFADNIPTSRAFYKLWEILHDFSLIDDTKSITYAALAEGPGGFLDAVEVYRKKYNYKAHDTVH